MACRIRAHNWGATPLGPVEGWPGSLRTAVDMVLAMPGPANILWGPAQIQLYNDAYSPIAKDRHPTLLGRPAAENWPEVHAEVLAPIMEAAFASRATRIPDLNVILRGPDGQPEERAFDTTWSPIRDASGAVEGVLELLAEVTDRRRAQAALRESEARLRDVLNSVAEGFTLLGSDFTIRDVNKEALRLNRRSREELVGQSHWAAFPGSERAPIGALLSRVMHERMPGSLEHCYVWPDGRTSWLDARVYPTPDGGVAIFWRDVTDSKRTEEALRESEARLRATVDAVPQIAWTAHADGQYDYYNRRWYEYTGLSREQPAAQGWTTIIHPDDLTPAQERWGHSLRTGKDYEIEYRLRGMDGAYRWFIARGVPVHDAPDEEHPRGQIARWFGTCTDVEDMVRAREVLARGREELEALVATRTRELMAAEETLRQAQKMEAVGQLTGGIAHDFNNMLQGVGGGLDMARRRLEAGRLDEVTRYLDAAREATSRAAGLTRRLLAFARRQRLETKPVDADGLVAGMADMIRRTVGPGIAVDLRLRNSAGNVLCDASELENALLNLCINARDAMPEGGRLAIGTEDVQLSAEDLRRGDDPAPGDYVAVVVEDTGAGIPPEILDRILEPFFTTKPQGQGTGLGLSQVYGFVRQSGGLMRIGSTVGQGTTVRLLLPLHRHLETVEDPAATPVPERAGVARTVLLIDDEDAVRRPVADRLRELGYTVLEARDGPEALGVLASSTQPDLLVTDVGLPNGMNGRQVAEAAREQFPGLPVLFITGYAGTALPPGIEVIGKPFELDALARRVQTILDGGTAKTRQ
ncbi:PAS domain-containing sensor histidine kinase [Roseomonas sp. KE2513]|uniref:hybrid sensor histidine kinase/response regulator n=1 Tax=Roseomonas sp. KE2513 TaxID=2479202 RepID=UPI0018E0006B|nr:PAS domain-containing sensor histidine kinase [Roseomonas sp. KE2513]